MPSTRVAVVIGSTRPTRVGATVATWVRDANETDSSLAYDLVDLAEMSLPLLDEPLKAALGRYEHEHTRAWSRLVSSYDGFLFVFPQYNWGYPAALKNAVDFLYQEWHHKSASVVTYGTRGGGKGAAQFIEVMHGLQMRVLSEHVEAIITDDDVDRCWQLVDPELTLGPNRATLRRIDALFTGALGDVGPASYARAASTLR